jgi:hypothetical protein
VTVSKSLPPHHAGLQVDECLSGLSRLSSAAIAVTRSPLVAVTAIAKNVRAGVGSPLLLAGVTASILYKLDVLQDCKGLHWGLIPHILQALLRVDFSC